LQTANVMPGSGDLRLIAYASFEHFNCMIPAFYVPKVNDRPISNTN
jgi:hypothetical protein